MKAPVPWRVALLIFLSFRSLKLTIDPIDVRVLPCRARGSGRVGLKRGINVPCHLCGRNARPRHTRLLDKRCRVVRAMLFLGDAAQLLFVLCTLGYLACAGVVNGAAPALQSLWGSRLRVCEAGVAGLNAEGISAREDMTYPSRPGHRICCSPATPGGRTVTGLPRRAKKLRQPATPSLNRVPYH